jgi:hypothetical protein
MEWLQSACGASVDRVVLRVLEWAWRANSRHAPADLDWVGLRDALAVYGAPALAREPAAFFRAPPPAPLEAKPVGTHTVRYRWQSGYRTWDPRYQAEFDGFAANQVAYAEHTTVDPARPTVLCLHPWMTGQLWLQRRIFHWLLRERLNVVLFLLPFHGARAPAHARAPLFPGRCPRLTNEAFGQLVWDTRALIAHLPDPVGVMGVSLGGYAAALLAGLEPRLKFSVPIIPFVDLPDLMWWHGAGRLERLRFETGGASRDEMRRLYALHSPLSHAPLMPRERRMIVAGKGDRICHPAHVERLWQHWGRPRIHWWAGSHVAQFGRDDAFAELAQFLSEAAA